MTATEIVTRTSPYTASETLARLLELISQKGLTLFAVIDHSGAAAQAGLQLRETRLVIFGSPAAGTAAMVERPTAALDLPLKILVWVDGENVRVSHTSAAVLAGRNGLSHEVAAPLAGIDGIAEAVVSAPA